VSSRTQTDVRELLEARGLRPTSQRLAVLRVLATEPDDATAQELHTRLRAAGEGVGLATVYRTLALLTEHGVVDTLMHHPGEVCYRLCGQGHHHHLVCRECHRVVEIDGCDLDEWLGKVAEEHGFALEAHTIEVTGVCPACSTL
jgi:Fur family ferric uptake transcriptional regulator